MPLNDRDQHGDEPESYPLMTNRPGVVAVDPVRRIRSAAVLFCLALGLATVAGAYVATTIAGNASEARTKQLRDETKQVAADLLANMDRRTAERRANESQAGAILEQNRRTLCALMRDLRERDVSTGEVDQLYVAYHCGTAKEPVVQPGWTPPPGWPALPPGPLPRPSSTPTPGPAASSPPAPAPTA
jgi:hypothetical protein